jgi:hypothetical protein
VAGTRTAPRRPADRPRAHFARSTARRCARPRPTRSSGAGCRSTEGERSLLAAQPQPSNAATRSHIPALKPDQGLFGSRKRSRNLERIRLGQRPTPASDVSQTAGKATCGTRNRRWLLHMPTPLLRATASGFPDRSGTWAQFWRHGLIESPHRSEHWRKRGCRGSRQSCRAVALSAHVNWSRLVVRQERSALLWLGET